ncbi:hypothetical protein CC80DRAFT_519713 [Byssothecium circinans]|uniref:Uncharacterized protein n=1 Tax=Byssothecium circinans TaxID=147558 RepID=A0A6A5TFJ7_9PLEO|nr:hypothetical protein CC80DRAFT_519713 [Byssothecium circinans]
MLSPAPSRPSTSGTAASAEEKPKKRAPRPKTIYNLAQPPPSSNSKKLSIRPKVLLQLHQVVASRRPKPVYEVIPYSILASNRRLARTFHTRKLCPTDILIVKTEGYEKSVDTKPDDVIAVICPGKEEKGNNAKAGVLLENGQTWDVTTTNNGGYELSFTDDHGLSLKSRWVPKPSLHNRRQSNMSTGSQTSSTFLADDRTFKFSTINANSRRHPVIATLTRSRIEIHDSYVVPSATSPPTPSQTGSVLPTPIATPSSIDAESFMDKAIDQLTVTTDDALRRFIVISGVWVAFCENWSPSYSYSRTACPPPLTTIIWTSTQFLHRNASFTEEASEQQSPASSPTKARPRRSNSTGTADLVQSGSTKKRFSLEGQTLVETEEERQAKRSSEINRIKELSLPRTPGIALPKHILTPIPSADPTLDRTESPALPGLRGRKARSAYDPVPTAGLWDSGVVEGPGLLKSRPTSTFVLNEKKMKAKKKEQRSKSKDKVKEKKPKEKDERRKSDGIRQLFTGIFRKGKKTA